ncbi:MAG: hypothetical protein AAGH68_14415 [Pseudomonadota bacterium]
MSLPQPHQTMRGFWGAVLNVLIWIVPITFLSGWYMEMAAWVLDERVSWPQISFMSAYPEDVRNGYLLFVAAVLTVILLSSALCGSVIGASPGKAMAGLIYVAAHGRQPSAGQHLVRALLLCGAGLMIMTPGPILGFVFGEAADVYSLLALLAGSYAACWVCFPMNNPDGLSHVNRIARVSPVVRSKRTET